MIEVFLIGVFFGVALGVALTSLRKTTRELNENEAMQRLLEKQDLIIKEQNIKIRELKNGRFLITNDNKREIGRAHV